MYSKPNNEIPIDMKDQLVKLIQLQLSWNASGIQQKHVNTWLIYFQ